MGHHIQVRHVVVRFHTTIQIYHSSEARDGFIVCGSFREERYEAETLRHHQAALLYNVLEPDWLQNSEETSDEENLNPNMNRWKLYSDLMLPQECRYLPQG